MAKSLVTKAKEQALVESNPGAGLPALFAPQTGGAVVEATPLYERVPYVQFVSTKGQAFGRLLPFLPDLNDGDPVLIMPEPDRPRKLTPFRFYLIHHYQHFSKVDSEGYITETTINKEEAKSDKSWIDHVETVLLVVESNDVTPARCTFKGTKVNAAHSAVAALAAAASPEWGKASADHQATLAIPDPRFRYTTTVTLKTGTGRASGFKYVAANGACRPTTIGDFQSIANRFADERFAAVCNAVVEQWQTRRDEILNSVQ